MTEECQGLPLALKVIGKAMFGQYPHQWQPLLEKLQQSRMHEGSELYECLKVSYDLLSERLKLCFHYFAAFPENSDIFFEEILFHWTGEGLIPEHYADNARADAFSLLLMLWRQSFIESNEQFGSDRSYFLNFRVHDVMRDLAFYILEKDYGTPHAERLYLYLADRNLEDMTKEWKVISEPPESKTTTILQALWKAICKPPESKSTTILQALRLSLDTNKLNSLPELYAPELVFLLLGRNPIVSLPANLSSYFPKLAVLNLRRGQFHSLPDELGDLKNLVCLDLSYCWQLEILPESIRKLHELKFLIVDDCWSLKCLPSGIGDLTSLQVLHTAQCSSLIWAENMLSWSARGEFGHLHPTVGASLESICRLLLLTDLTISTKEMFDVPEVLKQFQHEITHDISSPVTLQLVQQSLLHIELPHNISSLTKLQLLQISLHELQTLPSEMVDHCIQLKELELRCSMLQYLPRSFTCCGAFPALIRLQLSSFSLRQFPEVDEGAMCKLRILNLSNCRQLQTLPLSLQLLTSLRSLIVVGCNKKLKNCCRANCESSAIWRKLDILYKLSNLPSQRDNERRYSFHSAYDNELSLMNVKWRVWKENSNPATTMN